MNIAINSNKEIDYGSETVYDFECAVMSINMKGGTDSGKNIPFKATCMLEGSRDIISIYSWAHKYYELVEGSVDNNHVLKMSAKGTLFKDKKELNVLKVEDTGNVSSSKVIRSANQSSDKNELVKIINTYIKNDVYKLLINQAVLTNPDFWTWRAATRIHHAYEGGLAKHSLCVCKNAINIANVYGCENIDMEALVAGAILHDIGKLQEYDCEGNRTKSGNLVYHTASGYGKIIELAVLNHIPTNSTEIMVLSNIILSHHEKIEFGCPSKPATIEAWIVAKADALDAAIDTAEGLISNTQLYEESLSSKGLDDSRLWKWHE